MDDEFWKIFEDLQQQINANLARMAEPRFLVPIKKVSCDCGGERCKTTHAHWCSMRAVK
jgi:hypothetical protein